MAPLLNLLISTVVIMEQDKIAIATWPDMEWQFVDEIENMGFNKSDDYAVIYLPDDYDDDQIERAVEDFHWNYPDRLDGKTIFEDDDGQIRVAEWHAVQLFSDGSWKCDIQKVDGKRAPFFWEDPEKYFKLVETVKPIVEEARNIQLYFGHE